MAASVPISGLTALSSAPATNDLLAIVDVSDTAQSAQGSTRKITVANLFTSPMISTSLTVTGTASVSGNTTVGGTLGVTGLATLNATPTALVINGVAGVLNRAINWQTSGSNRWLLRMNATAESGGNAGSDMVLEAIADNGSTILGQYIFIPRAGGPIQVDRGFNMLSSALTNVTTINSQTISNAASFTGTVNIAGTLSGVAGTFSAGLTSTSPTAGVGYATGAGGTATQTGNRSAAVTINKICGSITTDTTSLASGNSVIFTVNNTTVGASDTIVLSAAGGWAQATSHQYYVVGVAANSFQIFYLNNSGIAETGAGVFNFAVIKGVTS